MINILALLAVQLVFLLCYIELQECYGEKIKNCLEHGDNDNCMCCKSGYRGPICSIYCKQCSSRLIPGTRCYYSCRNGLFGETCNKTCPTTCANGVSGDHFCTETNGTIECEYGCIQGYTGKQCSNCKDNHYYGDHCNTMCSKGCISETCNRTGHCTLGCVDGFYGGRCFSHCGSNCMQGKCTQDINSTYICTEGCVDGYMGSNCAKKCLVQCATCEQLNGNCITCVANYVYMPETGECKNQPETPVWTIIGLTISLGIMGIISVIVFVILKKKCNGNDKKGEEVESNNTLLHNNVDVGDDTRSNIADGPKPNYNTEDNRSDKSNGNDKKGEEVESNKSLLHKNDDVECNGHNKKGKENESNKSLLHNNIDVGDDTGSNISDGPKPNYNTEDNRSDKNDTRRNISDGPKPNYNTEDNRSDKSFEWWALLKTTNKETLMDPRAVTAAEKALNRRQGRGRQRQYVEDEDCSDDIT